VLEKITPLVITYNEEPNLDRTLAKLAWAHRVLVIDSGSTDNTLEILQKHPQVHVIYRKFDDFASQCNFGLIHVRSEWVLSLDADYELSDELIKEIQELYPVDEVSGYRAQFTYRIYGRSLKGSLYPPRTVLYRKAKGFYRNEGHGHRVIVDGKTQKLSGRIFHDDRKPLARWVSSQRKYAEEEARYLMSASSQTLSSSDRIRRLAWPAPILVFVYTLIVKRCIFDGRAGWYYVMQRVLAEILVALEIVDQHLRSKLSSREGRNR
jgi:glycosyltransferase involved in cell wall biosynthesis